MWAFLDYANIARRYYTHDYGTNWLSEKASTLFSFGVTKLYLPQDIGSKDEPSDMDCMLAQFKKSDLSESLCVSNILDEENPWFVATEIFLEALDDGTIR